MRRHNAGYRTFFFLANPTIWSGLGRLYLHLSGRSVAIARFHSERPYTLGESWAYHKS